MNEGWDLHYDRRVRPQFLAQFKPGMPAHLLAEIATLAPYPLDLQFRRNPKTNAEHASLYVGLTDVLKVRPAKGGGLRLSAHPRWTATADKLKSEDFGFDPAWTNEVETGQWSRVEDYLERVLPAATKSHGSQEGAVQAALSKSPDWTVLDREAALRFWDQGTKAKIMTETIPPIQAASSGLTITGVPKATFGGECDLLALDGHGQLLAVEIKPRNVGTIRWAAAQATVYSALFRRWLEHDKVPSSPIEVLNGQW